MKASVIGFVLLYSLNSMRILCPSKTFLVGEYAVLTGGLALLLATPPCFSWDNEGFYDPYDGKGGFGASGADFVISAKRQGMVDPWKVLASYKEKGFSGSGADIVCQWMGGLTYFFPREKIIQKIQWPFENLCIGLIHTGNKLNTHEHLEKLNPSNFEGLEKVVEDCYASIKNNDKLLFIKSISGYAVELDKLSLVTESTKKLLDKLNQNNMILATKGCGAMGSDVVLVIIEKQQKDNFEEFCKTEKLNLVYCDNEFAQGAIQYD
ncbi:MAG: hypothetical protein SFW07_05390 [Gammaproteobacteria bacterium]|nr:hypothetical protein [Gammaproteobacteria bacterium]